MKSPLLSVDLGGSMALGLGPAWLLLDCGEGSWAAWLEHGLRPQGPDAIAFTSGAPRSIAGLYGVLAGMAEGGRSEELRLLHSVQDERPGNLAGAFLQSEVSPFPLTLEADWPGAVLMVGGMRMSSAETEGGLRWMVLGGGRRVMRSPS